MVVTLDAWTFEQIGDHIATGLPLVPLFNTTVLGATAEDRIIEKTTTWLITRVAGTYPLSGGALSDGALGNGALRDGALSEAAD
ncbi:MAG: hypothetical protein ABSA58_07345 [Acetobacteraceae bacterium]|jgi:hypothetical protein